MASNGSTPNAGKRNWSQLTPDEWERIAQIYESGSRAQFVQEAAQLGTNIEALGRQVRNYRMVQRKLHANYLAKSLPPSPSPVFDEFTVIHDTDAIIISDIEVPDHSTWMLKAALLAGMRYGIKTVVFAGDLIATDQDALNTWMTTWREDGSRSFIADVRELKQIINRYGEWFETMVGCYGNHDMRLAKKTGGEVTIDMLLDDTGLQLGQYSYLYIFNPVLQEWTYVCHQFNYSKTSVKLAQDVWTVVTAPDGYDNRTGERIPDYDPLVHGWNKQKCHVIVTHTHVAQAGFSPDDSWNCIGMGCMHRSPHLWTHLPYPTQAKSE
jgi:hypothetical protein